MRGLDDAVPSDGTLGDTFASYVISAATTANQAR